MKNIETKYDKIGTGEPANNEKIFASDINSIASELENVAVAGGVPLDDANNYQLARSITDHALGARHSTDTGTVNNYILSQTGSRYAPTNLVDGYVLEFFTGNANTTTTPTLNYATLGVKTIVAQDGISPIAVGDIQVGVMNTVKYDGTNWRLILPLTNFIGDFKQSVQSANHGKWLLCNGQAVSRSIYSTLFAIIGTAFGAGNGSTTFTLPDCRGRVNASIGQGSGLTNRTLGQVVGAEGHTLTVNEVPAHTHDLYSDDNSGAGGGGNSDFVVLDTGGVFKGRTRSTGGGALHNIMQPTIFLGNTFIYAGI